ncbi:MAG TPA: FAD-dependent monooxygenase [Terriglobales bacterium]
MTGPEVLIVGAGPTGLVLALWLTKIGVRVRIVDKAEGPGTTSRALVMHARNLEFYRQMGIDRIAIERGIEFKVANLWLRGKRVGRLPFGDLRASISPYPYALIFPQDQHEEMLVEQLESLGVRVERNTELLSLQCSEQAVSARLRKTTGEEEVCQAAYLAGCDGAHSTVRESIQAGFPGGTYANTFYVADVVAEGPVANGELHLALDDADFIAIFPMKGKGRIRLVGALRHDVNDPQELRWEDVSHDIISRLKMEVKQVRWFSTYRVHHRVASHFQKHRIFLLGDAAHIHSPVGGQGMNTGIGDAVNLAWKLGAVLKAKAPAVLLDTYEPERIAFARKLVQSTDRAFTFVNARGPIAKQVRLRVAPRLLPLLFRFAAVRRLMYRTVSQTSISYPHSPLSAGSAGKVKGGDRLPWVRPQEGRGADSDNFASLKSMDWQVHVYGNATSAQQRLCAARELPLHVFPWNTDAARAGLKKNVVYVIRPDGHVGMVEPSGDAQKIAEYLDWWRPEPSGDINTQCGPNLEH